MKYFDVKWQDVYRGDSALVISENKLGLVIKPYGRKFHLLFPDGTQKTYDASELKFIKHEEFSDGGMMQNKPKKRKRFYEGGYMAKGGDVQLTSKDVFEKGKIRYYNKKFTVDAKRSADKVPTTHYHFLVEYKGKMYDVDGSVNENGVMKATTNNMAFPLSESALKSRFEEEIERGWMTTPKFKPYSKNELLKSVKS